MEPTTTSPFATEADRQLLEALAAEQLAEVNAQGPWGEEQEGPGFWAALEASLHEPPPGWVGDVQADGLRKARRGLEHARLDAVGRSQLFESSVTSSLEALGQLRTQTDGLVFAMAFEAVERGLHSQVGLSLPDWLRVRAPWFPAGDAAKVKQVVDAARTHWGRELGDALTEARTSLHRAALVARTMLRLRSCLDPDQLERYASIAIGAACSATINDHQLAIVCARLIHDLLDAKDPGAADRTAHQLRSVTRRRIGQGMTRFSIDAPSEESAIIEGILSSSLAAPAPTDEGPDERTAPQRKFDAIMTVLNRGLTNPGAAPSTARSTVILTIPFDPATGKPSGPGVTADGRIVSATTAGTLACKGDLTPVWISSEGEPLRLGRTARYATPGQWKALVVRDKHCTFPGCTVPPQWCDAHHIVWWSRGGGTDIEVLALLCGQHHTHVHLHDLVAEIIGGVVVWHV